jgi:iron complex outermembrane receptor protein
VPKPIAHRSVVISLACSIFIALSEHAESVSASDEDRGQLDPVVVTAQWRTEDLQSIPVALTAVTSAELLNAGVTDTNSLSLAVPGLSYTQQANGATPFIRGVGTTTGAVGNEASVQPMSMAFT